MKIAVYAISMNEEKNVAQFMKSVEKADYVIVADTGSTDSTAGMLKSFGARVYPIRVSPWRFDTARIAALALVPADVDVCISIDLDEVLESGWREIIEQAWVPGTTRLRYVYDWGQGYRFHTDKIHARFGYSWEYPCHETLKIDGRRSEYFATINELLVRHLPDPNKSRKSYIGLLELAVRENPSDPRPAMYYGRELIYCERWADAEKALTRYLTLSSWSEERSYAMRLIADACTATSRPDKELWWRKLACAESPQSREPWVDLAMMFYHREDWKASLRAAERALVITRSRTFYFSNPDAQGGLPYDLAAIAAWNCGDKKLALTHVTEAARLSPDDPRIQENARLIGEAA